MQVRCQRCGYMFTLSREAVAAALEEAEQAQAKHHNVVCPKCRRQIKVPIKNMRRFGVRQSLTPSGEGTDGGEGSKGTGAKG